MSTQIEPPSGGTPSACLSRHLRKPRLRRAEACQYLEEKHGVTFAPATLAKWATIGGGPVFSKLNRTPLYTPADLDAWVGAKIGAPRNSTSDEEPPHAE